MFKKGIGALVCLALMTAVWSWAATSWQLQTKLSNAGGSLQVRTQAPQTVVGTTVFKTFTTASSVPVSVSANTGYSIATVTRNGSAVSGVSGLGTYNTSFLKADGTSQSLVASFAAKLLSVTGVAGSGGSISPALASVAYGKPVTFTVTPGTTNTLVSSITPAATLTDVYGTAVVLPFAGTVKATIASVTANTTVTASFTTTSANAGPAQYTVPATAVTLNGAVTGTSYAWSKVSGPSAATLSSLTVLNPSFTPDAVGTYVFQLTVFEGSTALASSTTSVIVSDSLVNAMKNQCAQCHTGTTQTKVNTAFGIWSTSGHKMNAVACTTCHGSEMPNPVNAASVDASTFKITGAGAGTVGTSYCAKCHNASQDSHIAGQAVCTACHGSIHNPALTSTAAFLSVTSVQSKLNVQHGDPSIAAASGYAGSNSCRACHNQLFASWSNTMHNKPLKQLSETGPSVLVNKTVNPAQDDFVSGLDFNSATLTLTDKDGLTYSNPFAARKPNAPVLGQDAGGRFIAIGPVKYYITRAHGGNGKWKQRYQTKIGNAYYVLNVMYNESNGRYAEYNGQNWYGVPTTSGWNFTGANAYTPIFSIAGDNTNPALVADLKTKMMLSYGLGKEGGPSNSSWDNRCTGCHQTGMQLEYNGDATSGEVVAGYIELNVGCESCHGPAAAHAAAPSASNILNPQKAFVAAATPNYFKADEVCGQCHNRTEGAGHLGANGTTNLVNLPTESPSKENAEDRTKTEFYNANSADRLNDFVEKYDPGTYGNIDNSGALQYDGQNFPKFAASNKHHQTFPEIQQGKHGAIYQSQAGNSKGLSCWSCHNPHASNSSNMKSSINGVATNKDDNSLCLACHNATSTDASNSDFAGLAKASIGNAADELSAVNAHLTAKLGHTITLAQYQQSVTRTGTTLPAFGLNTIKVGNCVSCHMPLTVVSGIKRDPVTGKTAGGSVRGVGDVHNHTMKTLKATDVNGSTVTGGAVNGKAGAATGSGSAIVTSCSACHVAADVPGWL